MTDLEELRAEVDRLDLEIVRLLDARARCALRIGVVKRAAGKPVYQPEREAVVMERARQSAARLGSPLTAGAVTRIFERIVDEIRRLEERVSNRQE
jgi:chorismate mutase